MRSASTRAPARKPAPGRVVALYGAPGSGCSTLAACMHDCTNKNIAVVGHELGDDLHAAMDALALHVADVVIVDALRNAEDVQLLVEQHLIGGAAAPGSCVIQVQRGVPSATDAAAAEYAPRGRAIEQRLRDHGIQLYGVQNSEGEDGLVAALAQLARLCNLRS